MLSFVYNQEYHTIQVYKDEDYVAYLEEMFDYEREQELYIRTFSHLSLKECKDLIDEILKIDFILTINENRQYLVIPVSEEALYWNKPKNWKKPENQIYFDDSVVVKILQDGYNYVIADYEPSDDKD